MRIIPKKIKVKNTVWKCYSMTDVVVALFVFALIFIAVTAGNWALAIIMGLDSGRHVHAHARRHLLYLYL